ncbi:EF-hand domain-containing protein [Rhodovulum sp. YNF3179]|uniref:EF-hand domain-containing protein n=1 Tax=Rhodovulum sp. YNF3179 TaxID=3425127 RepID=UPI003D353B75
MTSWRFSKLALALALGGAVTAGAGMALADRGAGGARGAQMPFEEIDADGDGRVTAAEMEAYRDARLAEADANGDGALDKAELIAAAEARRAARLARMADRMLERRDADGDGKLSAEELAEAGRGMRLFERLDADGDGAVTEAEVAAMHGARMGRHGGGDRHGHDGRGPGPRWFGD